MKKINNVLAKPWSPDGMNFSERIWGKDRSKLIHALHKTFTDGMIRGDTPQKMIDSMKKAMNTSRYVAGRLVMTESAAFASLATLDGYKRLGTKQFRFLSALNGTTCGKCGVMDGKVFDREDYEIGVTAPPLHPNCRCTTVPHYDDEFTVGEERVARDENGKVYYVPADMTYEEWKKAFVDGKKDGLTVAVGGDKIKSLQKKEGIDVQTIGRIDIEKYRCITDHIMTDEVIITEERIQHIKERHPNDYERFMGYMSEIIADPDYIIEANKMNTAVILKEIEADGEKFKLILRLKVEGDPDGYKNSVISFWHIGDSTWRKTVKNKKILYKKE